MIRYIVRRLLLALVTLWALATLGFLLVEAIPGDPARQLAGPTASAADGGGDPPRLRLRPAGVGPLRVDTRALLHLDLGYSFSRSENARSVIARDVGHTLTLTVFAFVGELLIGIPLAILVVTSRKGRVGRRLARRRRRRDDRDPDVPCRPADALPLLVPPRLVPVGRHEPRDRGPSCCRCSRSRSRTAWSWRESCGPRCWRSSRSPMSSSRSPAGSGCAGSAGETSCRIRWCRCSRSWRSISPGSSRPSPLSRSSSRSRAVGTDLFGAIRRLDTALIIGVALVAGLVVVTANLLADLAVIVIDPGCGARRSADDQTRSIRSRRPASPAGTTTPLSEEETETLSIAADRIGQGTSNVIGPAATGRDRVRPSDRGITDRNRPEEPRERKTSPSEPVSSQSRRRDVGVQSVPTSRSAASSP